MTDTLQHRERVPLEPTSDATGTTWRPSPAIAAVLNLLFPGAGRLYAGYAKVALLTWPVVTIGTAACVALSFVVPGQLLRILVLAPIVPGVWIILPVDAFRAARRAPVGERKWWQKPMALVGFALAMMFVLQPLSFQALRSWLVEAFRAPSLSMEPAIMQGDLYFASRLAPRWPARGDVVVFERGGNRYIQRIVGLPGDTLAMRDYELTRNGIAQVEPHTRLLDFGGASRDGVPLHDHTWGPLVVPPDSVFVLGDTRNAANDSRYWGFVGIDRITGRPKWVYYSSDPETGAVRWGRIGRAIE